MAKKELPAAPAAGGAQKTKKRRNRKPKSSSAAAAAAAPLAAVDNGPAGNESSAVTSTDTPHYPQVARRTTHKKKKVLLLCSRGVTSSNIELLEDLLKLMPHSKKDSKFDKRELLSTLKEIAQLVGCHYCMYFEARKMKDLYMWVANVETGPAIKFLVQQIKPMSDLRLTGNCLLGSRPMLVFDAAFDDAPELKLMRAMLQQVFSIPKGHPRSKPFHDHVINFVIVRGRIVVRHYQVLPPLNTSREDDTLVEIGPRFTLVPIKVLAGAFSGETLYSNVDYVSPNEARAALKRKASRSTVDHVRQKEKRRARINEHGVADLPFDDLEDAFDD